MPAGAFARRVRVRSVLAVMAAVTFFARHHAIAFLVRALLHIRIVCHLLVPSLSL
jgi:hypothetical protein